MVYEVPAAKNDACTDYHQNGVAANARRRAAKFYRYPRSRSIHHRLCPVLIPYRPSSAEKASRRGGEVAATAT